MRMKKLLLGLAAMTMVTSLFTGCGGKEGKAEKETSVFTTTYTAKQADLALAPDVILEPEEPPYNLGGWMYENSVFFEIELPQDDKYTFTLEYSRPGNTHDAEGAIYLTQPDADVDDFSSVILSFPPTSEKELDWSQYKTIAFAAELPAGTSYLVIEPSYLPKGCDHFINLRKIHIKGSKPYTLENEDSSDESSKKKINNSDDSADTADSSDGFSGWWDISPNYYEGVYPVVSTFYVDTETNQWTPYDSLGQAGDTLPCEFPDDDTIIISMDGLGSQEMRLENDVLYYTDDDHEAYVRIEEPDFIEVGDYSGIWHFDNDEDSDIYYSIDQDAATKYTGYSQPETYDYTVSAITPSTGTDSVKLPPYLSQEWPGPSLYPCNDDQVIIEADTFRNNIYVREGASVSDTYTRILDRLVNTTYNQDDSKKKTFKQLVFRPDSTFTLADFTTLPEGGYCQESTTSEIAGTWDLDENILHITYIDGVSEDLDMEKWNGDIEFEYTEQSFSPDFYTPHD